MFVVVRELVSIVIVLGGQNVSLVDQVHALVDAFLATRFPFVIVTPDALLFGVSHHPLLTLRLQVPRIRGFATRELDLQLVEQIVIVRQQTFGVLVVDDFTGVGIQYVVRISYLDVGLGTRLITNERRLLQVLLDVVHRRNVLPICLLLLRRFDRLELPLCQVSRRKIPSTVSFHLRKLDTIFQMLDILLSHPVSPLWAPRIVDADPLGAHVIGRILARPRR